MKFSLSKNKAKNKGFTLVEMIVVIAIIALLTGIVTVNFTSTRAKARDAKRVSDLGQIQLALELVFDRCNKYPAQATSLDPIETVGTGVVCTTQSGTPISINTFMATVPKPTPSATAQTVYYYLVNDNDNPVDYVLMTMLETPSDVVNDDIDGTVLGMPCDDGPPPDELYYCIGAQ